MKKGRVIILLAGFLALLVWAEEKAKPPTFPDLVGAWVGLRDDGFGLYRLELFRDRTGLIGETDIRSPTMLWKISDWSTSDEKLQFGPSLLSAITKQTREISVVGKCQTLWMSHVVTLEIKTGEMGTAERVVLRKADDIERLSADLRKAMQKHNSKRNDVANP